MVVVWQSANRKDTPIVVTEIATSVGRVFYGGLIPELGPDEEVQAALQNSKYVLAELGACIWRFGKRLRKPR